MKPIDYKDIEKLWSEKLSAYVKDKIAGYKLVYSPLDKKEEEQVFIKIIDTLLDPFLVYSGPHRLKQWEKGWGQNLTELQKAETTDAVFPHYHGKYAVNRLNQNFVKSVSPNYERNMLYVILDYVFDKYFRKFENVYEFGCGTGHNLLKLREVNPSANLFGLDWAKSSQKIIKKMADSGLAENVKGYNFDFFRPDKKIKLAPHSAIYTVAALEQVGTNYKAFVSYLLKNKPDICVHIEPIAELLDENRLIDNLSIKYFRKRNYLNGYLEYLRGLEKEKRIKIIETKRTHIGSLFIEGYSIVIWKPI
ncbi:MAG: class I SAM-dependent methyltransferase [bacterium]|nr:class I SAM-dependent methyltransferase [bacterium]